MSLFFLANCAANQAIIEEAQANISEEMFRNEVRTLSSDEFMGRQPGQPGGEMTVEYLLKRVKEIGLVPVTGDGFTQEVPMVRLSESEDSKIVLRDDKGSTTWLPKEQFVVAASGQFHPIEFSATDVVFAGYGVVDSALGWDQFGEIDYTDKIVIIFRSDPGFLTEDSTLFNGKASSQHALFSSKYVNAEERGAKAAFAVLDIEMSEGPFGWEQVSTGGGRPILDTGEIEDAPEFLKGFISPQAAIDLLATRGLDYKEQLMAATNISYEPISLGYTADFKLAQDREPIVSHNILGMIPGTTQADEYVLYSAHWDHNGIDTTLEGDQIYNGAADNATGSASLMVLATSFLNLEERSKRSIIFMWDTAEEFGLLGSNYYTNHPLVPLNKTVVNINIDMLRALGETNDVVMTGVGKSNLDAYVTKAAGKLGMRMQPDIWPEENFYFRSDHINFARKGVPALDLGGGIDLKSVGRDSTLVLWENWQAEVYHKVTDEYDESWDVAGMMNYLKITFDIGYTISNQKKWPQWNKDDEFYPVRQASINGTDPE